MITYSLLNVRSSTEDTVLLSLGPVWWCLKNTFIFFQLWVKQCTLLRRFPPILSSALESTGTQPSTPPSRPGACPRRCSTRERTLSKSSHT